MKHLSIKMDRPIEVINVVPINPLISKCQIKVCWVGPEPNRNRSIITKEVAREMANSLPGSPIVGYYLEDKQDFEEHSREIEIVDGKLIFKDITRPYGFVDLGAKCWFEWFMDDGEVAREYLVTEGYLWTGQYPEARRIMTEGNNHSMELDEKIIDAHWTKDKNGKPQFFIINEAIISKLCILGEEEEPCFEGSQITAAPSVQFSLEDDFKTKIFSMMNDLKQILSEGGMKMEDIKHTVETPEVEEVVAPEETPVIEDYAKKSDKKDEEEAKKTEESTTGENPKEEAPKDEEDKDEKKKKKTEFVEEKICPKCGKPEGECKCEEEKTKYCLDEVVEYTELLGKYSALEAEVNTLREEKANLEAQITPLVEYKNAAERKEKENMIASFYMLSDEDKKEYIDNIDKYSVDEIEKDLSVICVRNKVSFALDTEDKDEGPTVFNLNSDDDVASCFPGWIKAAEAVAANKNK